MIGKEDLQVGLDNLFHLHPISIGKPKLIFSPKDDPREFQRNIVKQNILGYYWPQENVICVDMDNTYYEKNPNELVTTLIHEYCHAMIKSSFWLEVLEFVDIFRFLPQLFLYWLIDNKDKAALTDYMTSHNFAFRIASKTIAKKLRKSYGEDIIP